MVAVGGMPMLEKVLRVVAEVGAAPVIMVGPERDGLPDGVLVVRDAPGNDYGGNWGSVHPAGCMALNADGSVRHIGVMRRPTQATDTIQIAIDAIRRAAPFGDVTHVARPWKFTEVFLFDDERRFKPRILD